MEVLQEAKDITKTSFFSHVLSTSDEGKAEVLNCIQYASIGVVPIVLLNKLIQRFVPEADLDKSSLELLVEIFLQIVIMFCGIIVIHRIITYIPTYSGYRYEALTLTNAVLAFMVIILSIQSKLGIKANIVYDRLLDLWNGTSPSDGKKLVSKKSGRFEGMHNPSQADTLDEQPSGMFPPMPQMVSRTDMPPSSGGAMGMSGAVNQQAHQENMYMNGIGMGMGMGPQPANGVLGGSFGSAF
jgi:hypothetical protein